MPLDRSAHLLFFLFALRQSIGGVVVKGAWETNGTIQIDLRQFLAGTGYKCSWNKEIWPPACFGRVYCSRARVCLGFCGFANINLEVNDVLHRHFQEDLYPFVFFLHTRALEHGRMKGIILRLRSLGKQSPISIGGVLWRRIWRGSSLSIRLARSERRGAISTRPKRRRAISVSPRRAPSSRGWVGPLCFWTWNSWLLVLRGNSKNNRHVFFFWGGG